MSFWIGDTPTIVITERIASIDNFAFTTLHEVGHIVHRILGEGLVHHHAGAVIGEGYLCGAAEGRRHALRDLGHAGSDEFAGLILRVGGTDGPPHLGHIRDDIGCRTSLKAAGGQHTEVAGLQLPAVDLLQGDVDVSFASQTARW